MLTKQDLHNLRQLLNRVSTSGVEEARVMVVLAHKLDTLIAEEESREDVPAATE